jgi:hypothetical protein
LHGVSNAGRHKRTWVTSKNRPDRLGPGSILAALVNRVLTAQTAARVGAAASSCLEAVAIERNALGLGATASRGIQLQRSDFQSRRAEKVELVKTLGPLGGGLFPCERWHRTLAWPAKVDVVLGTRESISGRYHERRWWIFVRESRVHSRPFLGPLLSRQVKPVMTAVSRSGSRSRRSATGPMPRMMSGCRGVRRRWTLVLPCMRSTSMVLLRDSTRRSSVARFSGPSIRGVPAPGVPRPPRC